MYLVTITLVILVILVILLLFFSDRWVVGGGGIGNIQGTSKKPTDEVAEFTNKISGHNYTPAALLARNKLIDDIVKAITPDERVLNNLILRDIELYNMHNEAGARLIERDIIADLLEYPLETYQHVDYAIDILPPDVARVVRQEIPRVAAPIQNRVVHHDNVQNVHDTAVNDSVRKIISNLKERQPADYNADEAMHDLQLFLADYDYNTPEQKAKTEAVLFRTFTNASDKFSGLTEAELLSQIYQRGKDDEEKRNSLMTALEDCNENGGVVCATGRVNRMTASLSFLDDEVGVPVMTQEMIRNEAFSKAATLRDTMLDDRGEEFTKKYNAGIEDDEVKKFMSEVKTGISTALKEDYKHLENTKLDKIIEDAQNGI